MTDSTHLKLAGIAGLYLFWLVLWLIVGHEALGPAFYNWDETAICVAAALAAFRTSSRLGAPYRAFLLLLGLGLVLLAVSWFTYDPADLRVRFHFARPATPSYSDLGYILFVFLWICAWGYLAVERWQVRPPSFLTGAVFAILLFGLASILANFYYPLYRPSLGTMDGRLDAATSGLEFLVLVLGLGCILLGEPGIVTTVLFAVALLVAGDIAYAVEDTPPEAEAIWMFGQCLLLGTMIAMPEALRRRPTVTEESGARAWSRSGLSGLLILLALGGMILSVALWMVPVSTAWKAFFAVLFIVVLVAVLVWVTERFDETVQYVGCYTANLHRMRLEAKDWREADTRIRATLISTGLDSLLDGLRESAALLRRDVLFLGPERLFPPARTSGGAARQCFIVMPFSLDWSNDVHRILASACEAAGVRPMRGDDLFTPTDILNDIWQCIHAADYVIADITGRNPNVLHELGIAHTLAKPVLIISRTASDIPIDLSSRRIILYGQSEPDWREDLRLKVARAIREMVASYGPNVAHWNCPK